MLGELCAGVSYAAVVNCGLKVNESNTHIIYLIYVHTYITCTYTYYTVHMHADVLYVCVHVIITCIKKKSSLKRNRHVYV